MLKTTIGDEIWLVQQPDHARVSGYLAAHWGDANGFRRPGHDGGEEAKRWREEVVVAVAQHDNGWWEWEASPPINPDDGLPIGLSDVARRDPGAGFDRWRLGAPRFAEQRPYASLLISLHAYHLYAFAFDDLAADLDDGLRHPLFAGRDDAFQLVHDAQRTRAFLTEQRAQQQALIDRIREDAAFAGALAPERLKPHARLVQMLDAMSLLLCFGGGEARKLADAPRRGWDDRVTIQWRPAGERRIVCDPYPFDVDPLPVLLPARIVGRDAVGAGAFDGALTPLHATPVQNIRFELTSG